MMNDNAGAVLRGSTGEWAAMRRDDQGEKLDMTASVPCHGCLNGYGCYNEEQCSNFYGTFYPSPTPYGQPHTHRMGQPQPNIHLAPYDQIPPINLPYYDHKTLPPPQQQFMGYQQPHHAQAFYYGQPYNSPYYMNGAPYFSPRHQDLPGGNSKGYRPNNNGYNPAMHHVYDDHFSLDGGSDSSSLAFYGNISEDVRRAVGFVKRNRKATLFQIEGFIAEVAIADDGTRRFIQDRLRVGSEKEQRLALKAALGSFTMLANDEKGNCMIQDLFSFGTEEMKKEVLTALYKEGILDLSSNIHGCRIVQKAIQSIEQKDLSELIDKFKGHVINMIHDSHGNHVIQRCIQTQSSFAKEAANKGDIDSADEIVDQLQFIIDDVIDNIESLSIHRYGCRVVQRSIEYCVEKQRVAVLEAIIACNEVIVEDVYGNYVVQQAIVTGAEMHREQILNTLIRKQSNIFRLSKQKYASNVVEKLMQHGTIEDRNLLIKEILKVHERTGICSAILMAQDPIANYVVKKAIETAPEGQQKDELLDVLARNRDELLKSQYAKYIVRIP